MSEQDKADQYARKAGGWSDAEYADGVAYLDHRAALVATLGVALEPGDEVLDLACGDGGLGEHLLARGLRYRGVDSEPAMVDAAARRLGARAAIEQGDLNTYGPPRPVAATTVFRAIYYARRPRRRSSRGSRRTPSGSSSSTSIRGSTACRTSSPSCARPGSPGSSCGRSSSPRRAAPGAGDRLLKGLERSGPLARLALRVRFTYLVAAVR